MPTSSTQSNPQSGSLMVSSKVLGHISEGLYRGPAGVLKELISNAFDANATTVWISTGRPTFDVVSVRDDGDGMTKEKFLEIVTGGIGDSDKRTRPGRLINGRQMIGRLGIGILGVSQISHEFSIVSHARETQTAFRAIIQMKDFRKEILDQERQEYSEPVDGSDSKGFSVGGYRVESIDFEPKKAGLMITATEPTEGFRRQLSEDHPDPLPRTFRVFGETNRTKDELATSSSYSRMVWEIASLAPVPYLSDSIVPHGDNTMTLIANTIEEFGFSVIVDGIKLFKPTLLDGPTKEVPKDTVGDGEQPFHFPLELDDTVWGTDLKVQGYVYGSAGTALHPDALRGILIRLKHVGIGEYDKSLLDYRYAEGPRFAWLTGELFVEQGLENALTVGRDGFDAGHPHYIALRKWLHDELRNRVFPTLYKGIEARRQTREALRQNTRAKAFRLLISNFAERSMEITEIDDRDAPPVQIDLEHGVAILNTASSWPRGKLRRDMAQRLGIVFELVRLRNRGDGAIKKFVELTREVLSQR